MYVKEALIKLMDSSWIIFKSSGTGGGADDIGVYLNFDDDNT